MLNVKQRQLNLKYCGYYYQGEIDGIEGTGTINAYGKFQKAYGLIVDKIYGVNTETQLINVVKNLQSLLNKYGYNLVVDGLVGDSTINAIKDYQSKNGLSIDGIVGADTFNSLNKDTAQISNTWNDIKHFKKEEFTCECGCGLNNIDLRLVRVLDMIRDHFNSPIIITSGCRCQKYNDSLVGSVKGSKHVKGKASDFYVKGVNTQILLSYCKDLVRTGYLEYTYTNSSNMSGAVHIQIL